MGACRGKKIAGSGVLVRHTHTPDASAANEVADCRFKVALMAAHSAAVSFHAVLQRVRNFTAIGMLAAFEMISIHSVKGETQ